MFIKKHNKSGLQLVTSTFVCLLSTPVLAQVEVSELSGGGGRALTTPCREEGQKGKNIPLRSLLF